MMPPGTMSSCSPIRELIALCVAIAVVLLGVLAGPEGASAGVTLWVDDDGVECPQAVYTAVQAAVDAAAALPGVQLIRVCAGTYPENVTIGTGNSVTIVGDGAGLTKVTGVALSTGPIILADRAGRVEIKKLTVDGGSALAGSPVYGIHFIQTNGLIQDVEVINIRNALGGSEGLGVAVRTSRVASALAANVRVERTTVKNYTRVGIYGDGINTRLTVTDSTVIGPAGPTVWAANGIQISRGAQAMVKNNIVAGAESPVPPAGAGSGILLFCAGTSTVEGNDVSDSDVGVAISDTERARVLRNTLHDNNFDGATIETLGLYYGDLGCPGGPRPPSNNILDRNTMKDNGFNGVSLFSSDLVTGVPTKNRITGNSISGSLNFGIGIYDGSANVINANHIITSGTLDASDATSGAGTAATANTWTKNRCLTDSPDGLCALAP